MAIQFIEGTLVFDLTTGGRAHKRNDVIFSGPVKKVHSIVMRGYDIGYPNKDRPVHEIQAQLVPVPDGGTKTGDPEHPPVDPNDPNNPNPDNPPSFINQFNHAVVHVNGVLLLDDDSGNIDDQYHGIVDYTVIAEV